jgi:DNA-binding MarR family transcriptional regulator
MIKKTQTKKEPSYSARVLWTLYHYETLTTKEVVDIFRLTESHASNVLREMWKKGWLSRKIEYTKPHGRRFIYRMTEKGVNLFLWLGNKGVFENDI